MNKFVRISVPVCRGVLYGWWWNEESKCDAYYAVGGSTIQANDASRFVTYERDGTETQLRSVDDLLVVIRSHGCSPTEEVEKDPSGFAVVIGFLLNLAEGERVIEGVSIWRFLDEEFNVTMSDLVPCLKDGRLEFAILVSVAPEVLGLVRYDSIIHVSVDLDRGTVMKRRAELKPRKKNAFFAKVECPHCHAISRVEFQALIGVLVYESFEIGDVVIKTVPPEPTDEHPVGPSVECIWERPFWATGKGWCPACHDELTARIEIRERRFSEARPTLEALDLFAWGSLPDTALSNEAHE
jgi:hypothetical protein